MSATNGKRRTVGELATMGCIDREAARGAIKLFEALRAAAQIGERKPEGTRGGLEKVYVFNEQIGDMLQEFLKRCDLI